MGTEGMCEVLAIPTNMATAANPLKRPCPCYRIVRRFWSFEQRLALARQSSRCTLISLLVEPFWAVV